MEKNTMQTPPASPSNGGYEFDSMDIDMILQPDEVIDSLDLEDSNDSQNFLQAEKEESYQTREAALLVGPFICSSSSDLDHYKVIQGLCSRLDLATMPCPDKTEVIFGIQFSIDNMGNHLKDLTMLWRMAYDRLSMKMTNSANGANTRKELVKFYECLKIFLLRNKEFLSTNILQEMVLCLHSNVAYVDKLSELCPMISFPSMNVEGTDFLRFHLSLDVYWQTIEILHMLSCLPLTYTYMSQISHVVFSADAVDDPSLFSQMLRIVLCELVLVSRNTFHKLNLKDALSSGPFPCACTSKLWELILTLMKIRASNGIEEDFWVLIHQIFQKLLEDNQASTFADIDSDCYYFRIPETTNRAGTHHSYQNFCLWILTHLAMLLEKQNLQEFINQKPVLSRNKNRNPPNLFKKCLNSISVSEIEMRYFVHCCLKLNTVWMPQIDVLLHFWEYFYKRLNSNFQLNVNTLEGLASISKSSLDLADLCERLGNGSYQPVTLDNSFQMFLGLLGNCLESWTQAESSQDWRQLKGRILSKFHQRRVQELSETGLFNFTCLFLSLGFAVDMEDLTNRLLDFYGMVDSSITGRMRIVWMGMFAIMMIRRRKDADILPIPDRLVQSFTTTASEVRSCTNDPIHHHELIRLTKVYMDSLQEMVDSDICWVLECPQLLNEGFAVLLETGKASEISAILTLIQSIISKSRDLNENSLTKAQVSALNELYLSLMSNVLPVVKTLSSSNTTPPIVGDVLAGICTLSLKRNEDDFKSLIQFSYKKEVNKGLCCRFWSQLLADNDIVDKLSQDDANYQKNLIRLWVLLTIMVPVNSPSLVSFNRSLYLLHDVSQIMERAQTIETEACDKSCLQFIKALDKVYTNAQDWAERMKIREKYMSCFTNILPHINSVLESQKPAETLTLAYKVIGYVVKYLAPILFVQGSPDCPLPPILAAMIVFRSDKPLGSVQTSALKDTLPMFMKGLSRLEYQRDPYVQRQIKSIIVKYLPKFWPTNTSSAANTASAVHPLVVSLKESFPRQASNASILFRNFLLSFVDEHFLNCQQFAAPQQVNVGLIFIKDIHGRTTNKDVIASDTAIILKSLLTTVIIANTLTTQQLATKLASDCLGASNQCQDESLRKKISASIEDFIRTCLKTHLDGAINTLCKMAKQGANLIKPILPQIEHLIVDHESHAGSGANMKLRQSYTTLMKAATIETS